MSSTVKEPWRPLTVDESTDPTLPDRMDPPKDCVWVKNIFGTWAVVHETDRHVACVDPSYERYWCM